MNGTGRDNDRAVKPPWLAERLLRWWLPRGVLGASILGDAREELTEYRDSGGALPPSLWYWLHAFRIGAHYVVRTLDPAGWGALAAVSLCSLFDSVMDQCMTVLVPNSPSGMDPARELSSWSSTTPPASRSTR